jgi:biopolymer transport protein ExbD
MAAPSHMRKHRGRGEARMPLASMMDMMTIILLFLLKSYSATGALVIQVDHLDLPESTVQANPIKALSIVVDSGGTSGLAGVFIEREGERAVLLDTGETLYSLPGTEAALDPRAMILPGLEQYLQLQADEAREREERFGIPFEGQITIQADATVHYNSILKVLATCGATGYNMTEFVVIKKD